MPETWPRTYVVLCSRGFDHEGKPGRYPIGTIMGRFREAQWERGHAPGAAEPQCNDLVDCWVQRIEVASLEERDALDEAIAARKATIATTGIDARSVTDLQQRQRYDNRGQDGRVRTAKAPVVIARVR